MSPIWNGCRISAAIRTAKLSARNCGVSKREEILDS